MIREAEAPFGFFTVGLRAVDPAVDGSRVFDAADVGGELFTDQADEFTHEIRQRSADGAFVGLEVGASKRRGLSKHGILFCPQNGERRPRKRVRPVGTLLFGMT